MAKEVASANETDNPDNGAVAAYYAEIAAIEGEVDKAEETATVKGLNSLLGKRLLTDEQMHELNTFESLIQHVADLGHVEIQNASDFGNGYSILEDKGRLVGVQFAIINWQFHSGDMGVFVSMQIMTVDNRRYIVNDGGTGICQQMQDITKRLKGQKTVILVHGGFRVSNYTYTNEKGQQRPAQTYYISLDRD